MKKGVLTALSLCMAFAFSGCGVGKSTKEPLAIDSFEVMVYENYDVNDLNEEINGNDGSYYLFCGDGRTFTKDEGPFYKFWVDIHTNLRFDDFCSGESVFIVNDLGEYADHWVYLMNAFTTYSTECALGFYKGDLSDEEVKKALFDVEFVYMYKDKDGKNCELPFRVDESTVFEYEDYSTF